jgi:hypothetical protein
MKDITAAKSKANSLRSKATTLKSWVIVDPSKGLTDDFATIKLDPKNLQDGKYSTSVAFVIVDNCALTNVQLECIVSPITNVRNLNKPASFYLGQNYPIPFTDRTTINLEVVQKVSFR